MTIGYINVCQKGDWRKPFDMIMEAVKRNGLYEETYEIRLVVLNDNIMWEHDSRFEDPKIVIVGHKPTSTYERHALVHMANYARTDAQTAYWYAHTKGSSHSESGNVELQHNITKWIEWMCHWNFIEWRNALEKLQTHDVYGCEYHDIPTKHFSGNFHWTNRDYLIRLPTSVGPGYCDPEFWLCQMPDVMVYNAASSGHTPGGLYFNAAPI